MKKNTWTKMWSDRPYSLHLMSMVTKATVCGFGKIFTENKISIGANYWENGKSIYLYMSRELYETARLLAEKSLKSPKFLLNFLEDAYRGAVRLKKMTEKYRKVNLTTCLSEDLVKYIEEYSEKFHDFYSRATVAPLLGYQDNNPIYKKMDELIRSKTKSHPEKYSDYYTALTNPPRKLKTNLLDIEIFKLAKKAKKKGIKNRKDLLRKYKKELEGIKNKYEFLSFDFCDSISWSLKHFADLVMEKTETDVKVSLHKLVNLERISRRNFGNAVRELKLTRKEIGICNLVKYLGYQKWAREHEFQEAQYNLKPVQDELGRRSGLLTLESKYFLPEEYAEIMSNPKKWKRIAQERIKNSLCIIRTGKKREVLTGKPAKKRFGRMKMEEAAKVIRTKELRGMPASPGKAMGFAKIIITAKDARKMKKGDVLISQATAPDMLPAMKKASAIVTNEGGITAHAAIVSRELGIPCVVGTKIATKVLKDSDLVEVDAERGIVRIIKKI